MAEGLAPESQRWAGALSPPVMSCETWGQCLNLHKHPLPNCEVGVTLVPSSEGGAAGGIIGATEHLGDTEILNK